MPHRPTFAIVGAGLTGAKPAETVRAEGFDGRVVLIGAERERPYERPALSKGYLQDGSGRETLYVRDESFYVDHDIELRSATTATGVEAPPSEGSRPPKPPLAICSQRLGPTSPTRARATRRDGWPPRTPSC